MGSIPPFTSRTDCRNGVASIALSGELDIATVPVLEDHLAYFHRNTVSAIMVDLRGITFMDCSAVRAFQAARERAASAGYRLILIGASAGTRRVFDLTDALSLLDSDETSDSLDRFTAAGDPLDGEAAREPAREMLGDRHHIGLSLDER